MRVSGWGQDGPYRDRPGFGTLVESMSGYAARTGFADREPVLPPTALADMVAGLYGAFAVMVALRQVEVEGGAGQVIDLPLLDPLFSFIATEAPIYSLTGPIRPRTGSRSETTSPRNVFRTKDGRYIGISASIQAMAERLFRAIGREDMIADPRFRTNTDRVRNAEACEAPIVAFIGARSSTKTWRSSSAPRSPPRRSTTSTSSSPTRMCRRAGSSSMCPTTRSGRLPMHNIIPRLSETPGRLRRPAPALGEHTAEILGSLGVDRAALDALAARASSASKETHHDCRVPAGLALDAVRAGDAAALCRGAARRGADAIILDLEDASRPPRRSAPARWCRRRRRWCRAAAPMSSCASTGRCA